MAEKLSGNFPTYSMTGDSTFLKDLKELPKNKWLRVVKMHKRLSSYNNL